MAFPWVVTFAPAWVTHLHPMLLTLVCVCLKLCLRLVDAAISTNHNWQSSVFFWWRLGTPNRPHYCLFTRWSCLYVQRWKITQSSMTITLPSALLVRLSSSTRPWSMVTQRNFPSSSWLLLLRPIAYALTVPFYFYCPGVCVHLWRGMELNHSGVQPCHGTLIVTLLPE